MLMPPLPWLAQDADVRNSSADEMVARLGRICARLLRVYGKGTAGPLS
jgi:hypothetical protein